MPIAYSGRNWIPSSSPPPPPLGWVSGNGRVVTFAEKDLFAGIRAAAKGRTTLVISQRVTSVRWCDRIVVLEEGRVAAEGSHEDLLRTNAFYRDLVERQALSKVIS